PEICVPIKIYNGHVINLLNQNVDYIFAPRMVSIEKNKTFCPKFLGLPDMLRYTFAGEADKFISPFINGVSDEDVNIKELHDANLLKEYSFHELSHAWRAGVDDWRHFRKICQRGYRLDEAMELYRNPQLPPVKESLGKVGIGLIGYVYDVYDQFVGMDIAKRLESMGVNVYTFEMLTESEIKKQIQPMKKSLFWSFSNKTFGAGMHFYGDPRVDGLIHLTAFGCGPDSLSGKMMELDSPRYAKPFLTVRVDEHSGENHLQTRIEAFVDLLLHKKIKQSTL
ncbi:MAG: acyl-CoA dehydratase activase-related protein, partial [Clostridiales bacterium]